MGLEQARGVERRAGWTRRVRPMVLGAWIADLLTPQRRTIVESRTGLRFFLDPLSNFGSSLLREGSYEPETELLVRAHLSAGDSFLDVGANEGYFSVLAASIVGGEGYVAAVEPQSRLCEVIEINLALNGARGEIFQGALGGAKGESCQLYLSPALNTGYSSVLRRPRFTRRSETVRFLDVEELLRGRREFALVKVDVEGFEDQVVQSLLPLLRRGQVRALLLDYHAAILRSRGIQPAKIELAVLQAGMVVVGGAVGYRLYQRVPGPGKG